MDSPTDRAALDKDGPRFVLSSTRSIVEAADPPLGWVIPGYIGEGLAILAGRQKVGKTWLAMDWAIAVAGGGKAMGAVGCEAGNVLYVDLENGRRRIRARFAALCSYAPPPDLDRLEWASDAPPLGKGLIDALEGWRSSVVRPRLVVIDAAQKPGWRAGAGDVAPLAALQHWATAHGIGLVWLHRMRKVGDPLVALGGSGGVFGFADAILLLDRDGPGGTLQVRGRDGEDKCSALAFADGAWSLAGDATGQRQSGERARIIAVLKASDEPMAPREVAEALGITQANIRMTMSRMMRDRELLKDGHGLYTVPRTLSKEQSERLERFTAECRKLAPPGGAPVDAVPWMKDWLKAQKR